MLQRMPVKHVSAVPFWQVNWCALCVPTTYNTAQPFVCLHAAFHEDVFHTDKPQTGGLPHYPSRWGDRAGLFLAWASGRQEELGESTLLRPRRALLPTLMKVEDQRALMAAPSMSPGGHCAEMSGCAGSPAVPTALRSTDGTAWSSNCTSQTHYQADRCFSFSLYGKPETYARHEKEGTVQFYLTVQR